jgi:hypothetical protein
MIAFASRIIHSIGKLVAAIIGPGQCNTRRRPSRPTPGSLQSMTDRRTNACGATIPLFRLTSWLAACLMLSGPAACQQPPPDGTWIADAAVNVERSITDMGLGAVQGVIVRGEHVYAFGDVVQARPRVGVIREYTQELKPTGRVVWLRKADKPLILHPTGLTWNDRFGTFLGDTVKSADPERSRGVIYRLDWERAWKDGNLDSAVLDTIDDDAAINGCRPEFVTVKGRLLLATADYGDIRPEIRLYDPEALLAAGRSSTPGVVVHRILCGPFNQSLHWDAATGQLYCIQNVIAGRGWRLDVLDLSHAVADGRAEGPGVRVRRLTFPPHDELEGYWPLESRRGLFAVARRSDNLFSATFRKVAGRPSPPARPTSTQTPGER